MWVQNSKKSVNVHNFTVDGVEAERVRDAAGKYSVENPTAKAAIKDKMLDDSASADLTDVDFMNKLLTGLENT